MSLEKEKRYFEEHRAQWVSEGHTGKWAVISGEELLGFYESFEHAYGAGAGKLTPGEFLVKEVKPKDNVEVIQRVFWGDLGQRQEETAEA